MKPYVDTTSPVTHVSLCAGYGGIDLGLNRAIGNLRTIAFSEIEAFACANLVSKMEAGLLDCAPIWTNLKTFPWGEFRDRVDILSGGYPCQPFSAAGKRLGTEDPRHLWPYIADGIAAMRPSVCFFENVEGHISLGLPDVIEDLAGMGYRTTWGIFSASEVGAPHQRKRVFIMAHRDSNGSSSGIPRSFQGHEGATGVSDDGSGQVWPSRPGQPQFAWEPPRVVGNSRHSNWASWGQRSFNQSESSVCKIIGGTGDNLGNAAKQGLPFSGGQCGSVGEAGESMAPTWEPSDQRETQPTLGGNPNGTPRGMGHAEFYVSCDNRTDELRLLGNGVVPATAELAFRTLWEELLK